MTEMPRLPAGEGRGEGALSEIMLLQVLGRVRRCASLATASTLKLVLEMTLTERIEINPAVMMGKPVVVGTRIPVELIARKLSQGESEADLLEAYPRLTREDIRTARALGDLCRAFRVCELALFGSVLRE